MKEKLFFFSIKHPLLYILSLAIVLRIIAALFNGGFVETDIYGNCISCTFNHYLIPESWYQNLWIVYCTRLVLGAFSLFIITLGYRITKLIADKTTALEIAALLSFLWIIIEDSVHPVSYIVVIPFLLYGTLLIVKQQNLLNNKEIEKFHRTTFIIAGFFLGLGFAVEYTSLIFYIGVLIALFILKNWKGALMTLAGYVLAVGITQTVIDLIIYHRPFFAMFDFLKHIDGFLTFEVSIISIILPIVLLLIICVPPLSLMVLFGFIRVWRKYLLLFLPTLILLVFNMFFDFGDAVYSSYSFIGCYLTIIPTFIIAGFVGWKEFYKNSAFWTKNRWIVVTLYVLFAVINTIVFIRSL